MRAAIMGTSQAVTLLVPHESGIADNQGLTALMHAISEGQTKSASILAPYESKKQDIYGNTALIYAIRNNNKTLIDLLFEEEKDFATFEGMSPLMISV